MGAYQTLETLKIFLKSSIDSSSDNNTSKTLSTVLEFIGKLEELENKEMNNVIHDCYYDIFNLEPSESGIKKIAEALPEDLKQQADQWGWDDTEVGNMVYNWIKNNLKQ